MLQRTAAINRGLLQIVLLAPDMSPFCLELLDSIPNVRAIFEVGGGSLATKQELFQEASPKGLSRLRFQVADLKDQRLKSILMDEGENDLQPEMPTVFVVENANRIPLA